MKSFTAPRFLYEQTIWPRETPQRRSNLRLAAEGEDDQFIAFRQQRALVGRVRARCSVRSRQVVQKLIVTAM